MNPDPTPADGPDPYGNPDPEWLRIDWSAHRRTITLDPDGTAGGGRTEVNYVELGPPASEQEPLALVFVHGLAGSWQNWLENLPHFGRRHRVIALDLPGFGDSPVPEWEISIPAYGRFVLAFCDALGVRDAAIVGSSMGGFIAAETAIAQPGRFEKVVLVSAAGISSARLKRSRVATIARLLAAATPLTLRARRAALLRRGARDRVFGAVFHRPRELRAELIWEVFTGEERGHGFVEALTSLAGYDILDRLPEVEVPSLIVWGRNDRIVPPRDALEFERLLPVSRLEVFDECGHLPMAERPLRFNRVLEQFIAEPRPT